MIESLFASTALVALSEMGDKTQLLALLLTARFRKPWTILLGIFLATVINHGLSSVLGAWVAQHVSDRTLAFSLAVLFIGFGLWTLKPDTYDEKEEISHAGALVSTFVLFFMAEMGDKTQLATVALAARYKSVFLVTAGTTLGMMIADALAVFLGDHLSERLSMKWLRILAAGLFFIFGSLSVLAGITGHEII